MSAAEHDATSWADRMRGQLAEAAKRPAGSERLEAAGAVVRSLMAEMPDQLAEAGMRAEVGRLHLMRLGDFDKVAAEARRVHSPALAVIRGAASLPEGDLHEVPGAPGHIYRPASGDDPGVVLQAGKGGDYRVLLPWAPVVPRVYDDPDGRRWYEVGAASKVVRATLAELASAELWERLPAPGTGRKPVREVLACVVQAEAERAAGEPVPALNSTGWHQLEPGEWTYVFADGRAYPPRPVFLAGVTGATVKVAEAAAPPPELPDPAQAVADALGLVAEHGRGPALLALGAGVRSLGHSRQAVRGGYVLAGPRASGKDCAAWHARCLLVARGDRVAAFPPLPTSTFEGSKAGIENALHFERDMPALLDDAAVHDKMSRGKMAEVAERLDYVYRALWNATETKPRGTKEGSSRAPRYINSPVIATVQPLAMQLVQDSLGRRVFVIGVRPGDIDLAWYTSPGRTAKNADSLVVPLRTLAESFVIPCMAALGAELPGLLAALDAQAAELLTAAVESARPGTCDDEAVAGVLDVAAAAVAGLLLAAQVLDGRVPTALLTGPAIEHAVRCLLDQAAALADGAETASVSEAIADLIRSACLDGRAHVRSGDDGLPSPCVPGLTEQDQGLELVPRSSPPEYRGRGVAFISLPERAALGVRAGPLHKLIRAASDPRLPASPPLSLPRALVEAGAAMPNEGKRSPYLHRVSVPGLGQVQLILMRPEVIFGAATGVDPENLPNLPNLPKPRSAQGNRTEATGGDAEAVAALVDGYAAQVTGEIGHVRKLPADQGVGRIGRFPGVEPAYPGAEPAYPAAEPARADAPEPGAGWPAGSIGEAANMGPCARCQAPTLRYGPGASPLCSACSAPAAAHSADVDQAAAHSADVDQAAAHSADVDQAAAPERRPAPPARAASSPASSPARAAREARPVVAVADRVPAFLVLGAEGRAYGPEGLVVDVPPVAELVASARAHGVGALAELALSLPCRRLWVAREVRAALGLPEQIPPADSASAGYPHALAEAADPARWDVWPNEPVGLAAWMTVYRVPKSGEGADIVFAEWLDSLGNDVPHYGDLAPAELAQALTLIWQATVYDGNDRRYGGVHYHRSPATTFKHLVQATARRSDKGVPEVTNMPPVFGTNRPRGAPPLMIPGAHMAPPLDVEPGMVLAELDVNSCFASAARSTAIGVGECRRLRPGELSKLPGIHLVNVPADQSVIDPALFPWLPAPGRGQREVRAWLDTVAHAWLAECLARRGVPIRVDESYVWPDSRRLFDSPLTRLLAARDLLRASDCAPEQLAAAVIKDGYARYLGGWLGSDFGGSRPADDWTANRAAWLTIRVQAEVRKQRNLLPMIAAGVLVLGQAQTDTVYVAARSLPELLAAPGTGGRPAIADGRGKFAVKRTAEVTPDLAGVLGDRRAKWAARLNAVRAALGAAEASEAEVSDGE